MKTRNLTLLTLLIFLLTSCMPDSFTKFKEDPPTKTTSSGGSTGGSGTGGSGDDSGSGSGEEDTTPSDVVLNVNNVGLFQSQGDIILFEVANGTDFRVDDRINASDTLFGSGNWIGTVRAIHQADANLDSRILVVELNGTDVLDFDGGAAGNSNDDLPVTYVDNGYYVDNCLSGYGACLGTAAVSVVNSGYSFYVGSEFQTPPVTKNFNKRIKITVPAAAPLTSTVRFDYEMTAADGSPIIGLGIEDDGASDGEANDTNSDNDRLVSPYGPFAFPASTTYDDSNLITIKVSLNVDGTTNTILDAEEQGETQLRITSEIPGTPTQDSNLDNGNFNLTYFIPNGQRMLVDVNSVSGFAVNDVIYICRSTIRTNCGFTSAGAEYTYTNATTTNDIPTTLSEVEGRAVVDYIDSDNNYLYVTVSDWNHDDDAGTTNDYHSLFKSGRFIHNGSNVTSLLFEPVRLFRDDNTDPVAVRSLAPDWNSQNSTVSDEPDVNGATAGDGITYSVNVEPNPLFIDSDTGVLNVSSPRLLLDQAITITATNSDTGEVLDTYTFAASFFGTPNGATFASTGNSSISLASNIGTEVNDAINIITDSNTSNLQGESYDYGQLVFTPDPGAPTSGALPAGAEVANNNGSPSLIYKPSSFDDGATTYQINVFHPAFNPGVSAPANAFASLSTTYRSATDFDEISYPQNEGWRYIFTVSDASQFSATTDTAATDDTANLNLSNNRGARALVTKVDTANNQIYVSIDDGGGYNLTGNGIFKVGDSIDNTASFVVERATISQIVHVIDVADNDSIVPTALLNGSPVSLFDDGTAGFLAGSDESLTYAISPSVPNDVTFRTTRATADTVVAGDFVYDGSTTPLATFPATTFTISTANAIGKTIQTNYTFVISSSPILVSMGRYQFVRLSANSQKFYRGSRISNNTNTNTGRVIMPINVDGSPTTNSIPDGILVEFDGHIEDGWGIDNTNRFFGTEGNVVPHAFIDVKSFAELGGTPAANDILRTEAGDEAVVLEAFQTTDPTSGNVLNRIYARVTIGSFAGGEVTRRIDGSNGTTVLGSSGIISAESRHYATGIIEVNSAAVLNDLNVGEVFTTTNAYDDTDDVANINLANKNAVAIVLQKHYDHANGRYFVIVQHVSGSIGEADTVVTGGTNGTVVSVLGPVARVSISGHNKAGAYGGSVSSSGQTLNNVPFFEGSLIAGFDSTVGPPHGFLSSGFAIDGGKYFETSAGPDGNQSFVLVHVEDFGTSFRHGQSATGDANNNYIDDYNEYYAATMAGESHNEILDVEMSNTFVGYVGQELHLEPTVSGEFASASISPDTLPAGLTFDVASGRISGTPNEPLVNTQYQLRFAPVDGGTEATYNFNFVVYNSFEVSQVTENASSYITHQEGQGMAGSKCRVLSSQVYDDVNDPRYGTANYGLNDIICLMEGSERDLFEAGIEFQISSGAGMCEFVQYTPYAINQVPVMNSSNSYVTYGAFPEAATCTTFQGSAFSASYTNGLDVAAGRPLAGREFDETYCDGNGRFCSSANEYATPACTFDYSGLDQSLPNVDAGFYEVRTVNCTAADLGGGVVQCTCNVSPAARTTCSGSNSNALQGPIRDLFASANATTVTYTNSFAGLTTTESVSAGTTGNRLSEVTDDADSYYASNYIDFDQFDGGGTSLYRGSFNFDTYTAPGTVTTGRNDWDSYNNSFDALGSANASPFYTFRCLDASGNPKARIRMIVREWDREFTPVTEGATAGVTAIEMMVPDATNGLGDFMDNNTTNCFGFSCNSFDDWTDYIGDLPAATRMLIDGTAFPATPPLVLAAGVGGATTITFTRDTSFATLGGTAVPINTYIVPGTVIRITTRNGTQIPARVKSVIDDTTNITNLEFEFKFPYTESTGLTIEVPRSAGFPPY